MTRSSRFFVSVTAIVGGAIVFYMLATTLFLRIAHADAVSATQGALDLDWTTIQQYGLIPGIMVTVFAVASWLLKQNESTHWIAQGRTLALITAGMSILGAVVAWKFSGAPASTIATAAMAALSLVMHPTAPSAGAPAPSGANSAGKAAVMLAVLLLGGIVTTETGCLASQRESALKATLVTVDASREAYIAYDAHHQAEIIAAATSLEDGKAKLAAYRGSRAKVEAAFNVAYRALATAAVLNDDQSMAALKQAVADASAAVLTITGGSK